MCHGISIVIKKRQLKKRGEKSKIIRAGDAKEFIEVQVGTSNLSKTMFFHSVQQPIKV